MNLEITLNSNLIENLGWTLVHSIWQIALISAILFIILRGFNNLSANARYLFSVSALILALVFSVATFVSLSNNSVQKQTLVVADSENSEIFKRANNLPETTIVFGKDKSLINDSASDKYAFDFGSFQINFREKINFALPILVWLWLLGVGVYAFRLCGGFWQIHKYKTRKIANPEKEWQTRFANLCERLKLTQKVKLLQSDLVKTPIVVGWLKPLILVPTGVFLQINPHELETILAHELVHIRRYDNLVNFLQSFIEILFFYHPCVWWISASIRREREFACDDAVLEILESRRIVYADALANLEEIRLTANQKTPSLSMAASGGKLMKRIERIIEKNTENKRSSPKQSFWSASLALLLISAFMICVFSTQNALSVNNNSAKAEKKLAIGFVSIPPLDRTANPPKDSDATGRLLIEKLKSHHVPAIGFLTGSSISDGEKFYPVRANIARLWRDAGFEIGIGNFKHVWFYETPYDEYVAGVEKNEAVAKKLLSEKNLQLKYFSYPYLNTGKNADERNRFEAWLKTRGITPVKYTIDNQEWMYSYAYDMARNDNDTNTMKQIQSEFLAYMSKMFDHYEKYSQEMFGKDINQTMVLTPSRLVSDSADELFGMIKLRGYRFVSMDEAQSDEAYKMPENFYGKSGISWFERWQMAQGKKLLDEPKVSQLVLNIWNNKKADSSSKPVKSPISLPKLITSSSE